VRYLHSVKKTQLNRAHHNCSHCSLRISLFSQAEDYQLFESHMYPLDKYSHHTRSLDRNVAFA